MTLFRLSPHFSCLSFSIQSSSFNSEIWGLWNALIFGFKCAKKQHRNNRTRSARNKDVSSFWSCLCDSVIHADKLENSWNQLLTTAATDHSVSNLHACLSHSSSFSLHQSFVVVHHITGDVSNLSLSIISFTFNTFRSWLWVDFVFYYDW